MRLNLCRGLPGFARMRLCRPLIVSMIAVLVLAGCGRYPRPRAQATAPVVRSDLDMITYGRQPVPQIARAHAVPAQAMPPQAAPPQAGTPQLTIGTIPMRGAMRPAQPTQAAMPAFGASPYTLDSGDKLRVVVFGQDALSNTYSVDANGSIAMPLIGSVPARGLTTSQLGGAIAARLKQSYIREPSVAVEVEAHRPFFILGEVSYPGQYPFVANMTVETAVAIAGGFTPRASKETVTVTRSRNGAPARFALPINYPLQPGDTITVGERWF
jgi:polysaccharide export outer membrane protein